MDEVGEGHGGDRGGAVVVLRGRLDSHERRAGVDLHVAGDEHVADASGHRRADRDLHLHRLDHRQSVADLDEITRLHVDADDERGRRGANHSGVVTGEAVRHAVDLDEMLASVDRRRCSVDPGADGDPRLGPAQALDAGFDFLVREADRVATRIEAADVHPVSRGAVAQLDVAPDRSIDVRPAAARPAEEPAPFHRLELVGGVDRGDDERHVGVTHRDVVAGRGQPIEPAGVDRAVSHLRAVEQVEQERLVRRAAADDHGHLAERAVQAGQRLVTVAAAGDHLGDHRVELGWDHVALGDARVDPDAGPDRQDHRLDRAGRRCELALRVLGVEAGLDRVAVGRRRVALQATAGRDVELQLDEVESGRELRDRMLHLEPGVHLEERELLLLRLVEELDRAGVRVAGERGEAARSMRGGRDPARA